MEEIRKIVGDPLGLELYTLWKEYEEQQSVEALYCKDIDKFEMVMQAYEYEEEYLMVNDDKNKNDDEVGNEDTNRIHDDGEKERKKQKMDDAKNDSGSSRSSRKNDDDDDNNKSIGMIKAPLRTFYITTNDKMKSPLFRRLDAELRQKREKMLNDRGWEVTDEERQHY